MDVKKKIALIAVLLAVVLVLSHNIFPHHHVTHNQQNHQKHICLVEHEKHLDTCNDHNELCEKVYEFLSSSVQISPVAQIVTTQIEIHPHVCACKSHYVIDENVPIDTVDWQKNLPKRAPPFFA